MRHEIRALAGYAVLLLAIGCTAGVPANGTPTDSPSQPPVGGTPTDSPSQSPDGGGGAPTARYRLHFSGSLETVPGVSGDISFDLSRAGQIEEMRLDGGLVNFDCGGGKTIVDSGASTYFFPDPITTEGGRFSISRDDLDWDGNFDSSSANGDITSAHGNIRLSGGPDCANRPPAVTWSATVEFADYVN